MPADKSGAPITLFLRSERFRFVSGEARLVPFVDGYDDLVGEVRDDRVTGLAIEPGSSLFGFVLTNAIVMAVGRSAPAPVSRLQLPTILLTPATVARGTHELKIAARTIASVRVKDAGPPPAERRILSMAQPHLTVELPLDEDDRATVLLSDGYHSLTVHSGKAVNLVIDATSPAWLDVTLATAPG